MNNLKVRLAINIFIAFLVIFLLAAVLVITLRNNKMLNHILYEHMYEEEIVEDTELEPDPDTAPNLSPAPNPEIEIVLKRLEEIQGALLRVQIAINRLLISRRDEDTYRMLTARFFNEYKERGLNFFNNQDYANAANAFDMALSFQQNNTTLLFYQTYASYLSHVQSGRALSMSELTDIQTKVLELLERGFRAEEQIYYSIEEMERRVLEMGYNTNVLEMTQADEFESIETDQELQYEN
jgi:flagellar basal body-associated protein FliL